MDPIEKFWTGMVIVCVICLGVLAVLFNIT